MANLNSQNISGRFFVQTNGFHKGETLEALNIIKDRDGVFVSVVWDCGPYVLEPICKFFNGTFKEIAPFQYCKRIF